MVLVTLSIPFSRRFAGAAAFSGFGVALLVNNWLNIRYYRYGLGGRVSAEKNPIAYWAFVIALSVIGAGFIAAGVVAFFILDE